MNWSFSVSSCNKSLLQKGIICLNLVCIWYIFPTHTFVLNAVKEPGIFFFWGGRGGEGRGGCGLIKAFWTVSQWVNPGVSNWTKSNKKIQSNSIERLVFDWVRQSNKIEHLFCCEFDFRTNRTKSN